MVTKGDGDIFGADLNSAFTRNVIGRDRELAQFDAVLAERKPALILVTGEDGMGKTALLREFKARATDWNATSSASHEVLRVKSSTTVEGFCTHIRRLLGIYDEENGPAVVKPGLPSGHENMTPSELRQAQNRQVSGSGSRQQTQREQEQQPFERDPSDLHSIVKQLRDLAPVLLLIDLYEPEAAFATWFKDRFIANVKQSGDPIVIVVAGTDLSGLPADEEVSLGPLDQQAVRQRLEMIGEQMIPQLEATELNMYVEAACKDPGILHSLLQALGLAIPQE